MIGEFAAHQAQILQPELIINLGRFVSFTGELSASDQNRLKATAFLTKNLGIDHVVTSGRGQAAQINPAYAEAIQGRHHLIEQGIEADRIHCDTLAEHTWDNAIYTRILIENHESLRHLRNFLTVSSVWHDRVLPIFDHVFGDEYNIGFFGAHDPPSAADLRAEVSGKEVMHQIIANTPRGDLEAIRAYTDEVLMPASVLPLAA